MFFVLKQSMKTRLASIIFFFALTGTIVASGTPVKKNSFKVYPNPVVNKEITIKADLDFNKIEILGIVGQVVYSKKLEPSNSVKLGIDLQPGMYLIRLSFTNTTSNIKRIWVN